MAFFDPEIDKLESAMERSAKIQEIISHNIANANTPGYVAMEFDAVLNKAVERSNNPKVTMEQELAALSENGIAYSSYTKLLITKLNVMKTIATQGRR
jgi:flagellar basal body rod protein FlgB